MQVLLLRDVPNLGKAGEVVTVAEGYARNYLVPRRLAEPASKGKLAEANRLRRQREKRAAQNAQRAADTAADLKEAVVPVRVKTGEGGKLFGAVTGKDIAAALKKEFGVTVDKKQIVLGAPLKEIGTYPVAVRLAPGVSVKLQVNVTPE
ncbi:MAG TPA: 50S ribosomal protein L9 [Desulfotomaculum sp.]|nr:50S ribosomal protein L9 [Desulfotomaculum sp.]